MTELQKLSLKPCPFCGGEASYNTVTYSESMVEEQEWSQAKFHGVNCIHCGVSNLGLVGHRTTDDAARHWNVRHTTLD
jgi:hypothetical protein